MTEAEWLASTDLQAMLAWLTAAEADWDIASDAARERSRLASDRRLRLFACACCRAVWHLLADERSRRAVEVAEQYADGAVRVKDLGEAWGDAVKAREDLRDTRLFRCYYATSLVAASMLDPEEVAYSIAATPKGRPIEEERAAQAALLREVVGNPFRPAVLAWREGVPYAETFARPCPWLTPTVVSLARAAYDERRGDGTLDPARLAVLSDALEEAGCAERAVMEHLRGWRPYPVGGWLRDASSTTHVRGCWAVDLILGRD